SVMARAGEYELLDTARLTAMGGYLGLFADWCPAPLPIPITQVCPKEPVRTPSGEVLETGWQWPGQAEHLKVPGDHLTVLEEHATSTAEDVEESLGGTSLARPPGKGRAPTAPTGRSRAVPRRHEC